MNRLFTHYRYLGNTSIKVALIMSLLMVFLHFTGWLDHSDNQLRTVKEEIIPFPQLQSKNQTFNNYLTACNNHINVNLQGSCSAEVTASDVLEGVNDIKNNEYAVIIDYGNYDKSRDEVNRPGTFPYELYDQSGTYLCSGRITAEDKTPPAYNGQIINATVSCSDLDTILKYSPKDLIKNPQTCQFKGKTWDLLEDQNAFFINDIYDNCTDFCDLTFEIHDQLFQGDICEEGSAIQRTIKVTDKEQNVSTFRIRFVTRQLELFWNDIQNIEIDLCNFPNAADDNYLTLAGSPYWFSACKDINSQYFKENLDNRFFNNEYTASFCGQSVSFQDEILPISCGGQKIIRKWTILNWCEDIEGISSFEGPEQIIKVGYFQPPSLSFSRPLPTTISTDAFNCKANFMAPVPTIQACSGNTSYSVNLYKIVPEVDQFGLLTGNLDTIPAELPIEKQINGQFLLSGLPIGNYELRYIAQAGCGETADFRHGFNVADLTEPIAVCNGQLNLTLSRQGIGQLLVDDVDAGSRDNCMLESVMIRRPLDSCLDQYLNEIIGVPDLSFLQYKTTIEGHDVWFKMDASGTKEEILITREPDDKGQWRYYSAWSGEVYFLCCDLATSSNDFLVVDLKATDINGNSNTCWMNVLVENKLTPRCIAPPDIQLNCWEFPVDGSNLKEVQSLLGSAESLVASGELKVDFTCDYLVQEEINWQPNACSEGILDRTFTIISNSRDKRSSSCSQRIQVTNTNDYAMIFPGDASQQCGDVMSAEVTVQSFTCDIFAVETDTSLFLASDEECFKRFLTHEIINWCEYDGQSLEPTVIVRDIDCDGDLEESTYVKSYQGQVWIDDDSSIYRKGPIDNSEEFVLSFDADAFNYKSNACDGKNYFYTPGFWSYTQVIKVYDNTPPSINIQSDAIYCAYNDNNSTNCTAEVSLSLEIVDACTEDVEVREILLAVNDNNPINLLNIQYKLVEGGNGTFDLATIEGAGLPLGEHYFLIKFADDCGNINVRKIPFSVVDCKTPAPICVGTMNADLLPNSEDLETSGGSITLWANDFPASDIFDCTPHPNPDGNGDVRYYVFRESFSEDPLLIEQEVNRQVTFTCDDGPFVPVFLVAIDGAGNFDFCTVIVQLTPGTDPNPCIDNIGSAIVSGRILTEDGEAVESVRVTLSSNTNQEFYTDLNGRYTFENISKTSKHTLIPSMDHDPTNGVSTFDLVLMTKHILNIAVFNSPYKMIAADVNHSGTVTTLDLIQLRKLILSVDDDFRSNTSWRFVDANYQFINPQNPFREQFPEAIELNKMTEDKMEKDFIAVKVGDVNLNALTGSIRKDERRASTSFQIDLEDQFLEAGELFELKFTTKDLLVTQGFQFTLGFSPSAVTIDNIEYGKLQAANIGLTHLAEGILTTSWNQLDSEMTDSEEQVLFTLHLKATNSGKISNWFTINSRYTKAEAYDKHGDIQEVRLAFMEETDTHQKLILYQNNPNPFSNSTIINFYLPENDDVTLIIRDTQGSIIKRVNGTFQKGNNAFEVDEENLPTGILYYTVRTSQQSLTKKMLHIGKL